MPVVCLSRVEIMQSLDKQHNERSFRMFAQYLTRCGDCSLYKDIPIELLPEFRKTMKSLGLDFKVKFRGRRVKGNGYTLREHADRFAVYPNVRGRVHIGDKEYRRISHWEKVVRAY